jgi:GT2 family glycosyltransferase
MLKSFHTPSVSVVTLTKDRALLLRLCLDSLVGQLFSSDEIIVLDNASTDNTRAIISEYKHKLPIRYFYSKNQGYPKLYNTASSYSTKQILIFFDDDCVAEKHFIEKIRLAHAKSKLCHAVQGMTYSVPKNNIYADITADHYKNWLLVHRIRDNEMLALDNKNVSLPRRMFVRVGGYREELFYGSEDVELGVRLRRGGIKILFDPSIVAYHHERDTLKGFLQQHLRIAISEARLNMLMPKEQRLTAMSHKKTLLNLRSAATREGRYLQAGNIVYAVLLPFLYIALAGIRLWGYYTTTWKLRK